MSDPRPESPGEPDPKSQARPELGRSEQPSPLSGPPIFARPKPEEIPPEPKAWRTVVGLILLIVGVPAVANGLLGVWAALQDTQSLGPAFVLLAASAVFVGIGLWLITANHRAQRAWEESREGH